MKWRATGQSWFLIPEDSSVHTAAGVKVQYSKVLLSGGEHTVGIYFHFLQEKVFFLVQIRASGSKSPKHTGRVLSLVVTRNGVDQITTTSKNKLRKKFTCFF